MEMKSYGDSNVYFDEIKQLLVKRFAFVWYWRKGREVLKLRRVVLDNMVIGSGMSKEQVRLIYISLDK
jgi:hypothetical protein